MAAAKKRVVRRRPIADPDKEHRPAPRKSKKKTEMAWVRLGRPEATCGCGKLTVRIEGTDAVVYGSGWLKEYQWIVCSKCSDWIRISPRVVWQHHRDGKEASRTTTGDYAGEGNDRRIK